MERKNPTFNKIKLNDIILKFFSIFFTHCFTKFIFFCLSERAIRKSSERSGQEASSFAACRSSCRLRMISQAWTTVHCGNGRSMSTNTNGRTRSTNPTLKTRKYQPVRPVDFTLSPATYVSPMQTVFSVSPPIVKLSVCQSGLIVWKECSFLIKKIPVRLAPHWNSM